MTEKDSFDWIPFYEELANTLPAFRSRQKELVEFLEQLRAQGLTLTPFEDRDDSGRRFPLLEIDPFTFFGSFNRGIVPEMRIRILESVKSRFGLNASLPTAFSGVPTVNNQKSWFFAFKPLRKPGDIDRLWDVFTRALGDDPMSDPQFAEAFDRALDVRNTNINLTMGLFWIRPQRFVSLDSKTQDYLGISLPKEGLSFDFYRTVLKRVLETNKETDLPHLSYSAHLARLEKELAPSGHRDLKNINEDVEYWLVGAYWEDHDPQDQTERFVSEGIWKNGWKDRFLDQVKEMKVGDRIAIKAMFTQKHDLPFDNRGNTVSAMTIKATGTIVKNRR